ncbi:lipase family protein [Nocardia salmonicida]|uniref:lipase family protein n=1 Tax=Nocardia salmonicida TaxID=53431 RepID=UPI0007A4D255|nr:lipase family protein [Nocardia salmonicida]
MGGGAASGTESTYATRTSRGVDAESSAVAFVPTGAAPAGCWPIIAWAHGTTGVADTCAPSVTGLFARNPMFLTSWIDNGYAVVATDYIGLGTPGVHAYLDARSEGNVVVDSVRAVRQVTPELSTRWAVVGQSQGGRAALATANIATRYTPELDFRDAVATAPPSNIENLLGLARPELPPLPLTCLTTFMSYIVAGVRAEYPEIDPSAFLTPLGIEAAAAAERLCAEDFGTAFSGTGVGHSAAIVARPPAEMRSVHVGPVVPIRAVGGDRFGFEHGMTFRRRRDGEDQR